MRRIAYSVLAAALAAFALASAATAQVSVSASLDRTRLAVGESTLLDIKISGAQNAPAPELGDVPGFGVRYIGPATQMTIINGQMEASVSHRYQLTARAAGRLTVGPFDVPVGGTTYHTQPIAVQVAQQPAGSQRGATGDRHGAAGDLRLELRPDRTSVYVGEKVPVTVKLLVSQGTRVEDLQYPAISAEGAVIDKLSEPAQRDEVIGGRRYRALYFETRLVPLRAGSLSVGATMGLTVLVPQQRRGLGFGGIFGDVFADRRARELSADPVSMDIKPLPVEGRPPGFGGAVGTFTFDVSASPRDVQEGDPITVRMRIAGEGDLSKISPPRIAARDDLRVYDPLPAQGAAKEGERVFEQVVIPLRAGPIDLPPLRFSYFDPAQGTYRTIERGPIPVVVRPSATQRQPGVVSSEGPVAVRRENKSLGRDIVFIKEAPGTWIERGRGLAERPLFILLQMIPVALLGGVVLFTRRRERFAANPRLRRFRAAGEEARRGLAKLEKDGDTGGEFYDRLAGVVSRYLAAKLDLPPGGVDGTRVAARLREIGAATEVGDDVNRFFDLLHEVRYASSADGVGQRGVALEQARRIVSALERERRVEAGMTRSLATAVALVLAAALLGAPARGADAAAPPAGPGSAFFAGNASYAAGDYAAAVRSYESILDSGVESGPLLFNLGNAWFKQNDAARAIANYMRAERLLPRDPDVAANLAYAREVAKVDPPAVAFWQRALFVAAYRLAASELGALATLAWWLACALWAARLLLPARATGLGRAAWGCAAVAIFLFVNLLYRDARLELHDVAVVTAAKETLVRFEPAPTGTQHFAAVPGTSLTVTDEHDDWLQVAAADGRRGWIPAAAVTRLR